MPSYKLSIDDTSSKEIAAFKRKFKSIIDVMSKAALRLLQHPRWSAL